jgi:hypothetical protein
MGERGFRNCEKPPRLFEKKLCLEACKRVMQDFLSCFCFLVDWWLELVSLIYKMKKAPPPSVFAVVLLD